MKKNTLLVGLVALLMTSSVFAQDLVIKTMKGNENIQLLQDAKFDPAYGNVGNTSTATLLYLGEVDFGADGNNYQATAVEYANGWGSYEETKYVVLHAGETYELSSVFNEMGVIRTFGYHCFENFAENMKEGEGFVRPTGVQKVWLTFREGSGNLRSVTFYKNRIPDGEEGMQPWVCDLEGYNEKSTTIPGAFFEPAESIDPEGPYKDTHYDENSECWGWIGDGFVLKSTQEVDFGNGDFKQLVAFIGHDSERYQEYMEFYIDAVAPENQIVRSWAGINLSEWNSYTPLVSKLGKVTGKHYLFVKFGNSTNLNRIDLVKEELWVETPMCGVVYENVLASEKATCYTTLGGGTQGGDPSQGEMEWEVLLAGPSGAHGEGANIGYTANGVVVAYYDIDFKDGEYKRVVINHSCDKTYLGTIDDANFSLYVDLEEVDWSTITSPEELKVALAAYQPIAVVRAQGTGNWGTKLGTAADLKEVKGVHSIYVVYNLPGDGAGANIYGLYLDPEVPSMIKPAAQLEGVTLYALENAIGIHADETLQVAVYTLNGMCVAETVVEGNGTIANLNKKNIYIVKMVNNDGAVKTTRIVVK